MKHILQRMYDSEINVGMESDWDAGFRWWCGWTRNLEREEGWADTFEAAVEAVRQAAIRLYPDSDFAKEERGKN